MIKEIIHVGLTVSNIERSVVFYCDILKMRFLGELLMQGPETDMLFAQKDCTVRVAYLSGGDELSSPPVELIEFVSQTPETNESRLDRIGISEICFQVPDIEAFYAHLQKHNVPCLSEPQFFDFSADGFGKSKALYFRDPDGIILEAMQIL
ncbi:MAG: VOC family protein [Candidatus Aphodousia sp.]|nr:VOC family protein [Candidatus Aphodousia sp.]